jgi:cytochrome c-type biogenesis protein CcmH/NrfG
LLAERKQYDDAEVVLTQAVRRDGKNPANYLPLGVVYAAKRKPKQAIENYELFLKYAPKNDPDRARVTNAINELRH